MGKYIKQHYVPKFYLKNFCNDKGAIYCYDKVTNRSFPSSLSDAASEGEFYEVEEIEHATVEKSLSFKEQYFRRTLYALIEMKDLNELPKEWQKILFYFLACQIIRTPEFRADIKETKEDMTNIMAKDHGIKIPQGLRIYITPDTAKRMQLRCMLDYEFVTKFADLLYFKNWYVNENKTSIPLWISDHPVTVANQHNYQGNLGIDSPGAEIHFPLTPTLCLSSYDPVVSRIRGGIPKMVPDNVVFHNELQTQTATRFIYSPSEDFMVAKRYLKTNPVFKDPLRRRTIVKNDPHKIDFLRTLYSYRIDE